MAKKFRERFRSLTISKQTELAESLKHHQIDVVSFEDKKAIMGKYNKAA